MLLVGPPRQNPKVLKIVVILFGRDFLIFVSINSIIINVLQKIGTTV